MRRFRSKLRYGTFLKYSPYGKSELSELSRLVRSEIKNDSSTHWRKPPENTIGYTARRIREEYENLPFLSAYIGSGSVLVPMPRSTPRTPGALWPALRICESLLAQGLARAVVPCLERLSASTKSATAAAGKRWGPGEHYETFSVTEQVEPFMAPATITLVDDFVTSGSTFLAAAARLHEALPKTELLCFALCRTVGHEELTTMLDPVEGTITYKGDGEWPRREP